MQILPMLTKLKQRWDIENNWQLIFPVLAFIGLAGTAYTIARAILNWLNWNNTWKEWPVTLLLTSVGYFLGLKFFLWCFKKLENKWVTTYRWEMIAIFLVFAVTGSLSGKLAAPLTHAIGVDAETSSGWLYWPLRILLIFPYIKFF